jgi:hypothetical protein
MLLEAILELQQLRMLARYWRHTDPFISKVAFASARLLCAEIRSGKLSRPMMASRRELLTSALAA